MSYIAANDRYQTMEYRKCGRSGLKLPVISQNLHCLRWGVVSNQNSYSIFDRTIENNGLKHAAKDFKKGIIAFSPLAQGLLTDKYLNGIPEDSRVVTDGRFLSARRVQKCSNAIDALNELAKKRGKKLSQWH